MEVLNFNDHWFYKKLHEEGAGTEVALPHDAMIREDRNEGSTGGHNIGWFECHDYQYEKWFRVPADYEQKKVFLEFEGVYRNAEVYVNGRLAAFRPYGYTNFYIELDDFLEYGKENHIKVIAKNTEQPNSRWYSGAGIYRPVTLYTAEAEHIKLNGIKIHTVSINPAVIEIQIKTSAAGPLDIEILKAGRIVAAACTPTTGEQTVRIEIPDAVLWSPETPARYLCRVFFKNDTAEEFFGIRLLKWDAEHGLTINGTREILRGACIHHDNGVLGACSYPEAEERKIRILKENGYNAVRSAHNPCSKALLDACDRLGMLAVDEYVDVWYIHKTQYDYVQYFEQWWEQDLKDMVDKDYNHPSVIMYSTGNEVSETAQKRGIELTGKMTGYLHQLDATRPVTCGINIFFNFLSAAGFGVYSDEKAKKEAGRAGRKKGKQKKVGSEFYNTLAGIMGSHTMKTGATFFGCDIKTRAAFANMDIAGYNYGIYRYRHDLKKYPRRLILGSETFCSDTYDFWEMAKKHNRIIGDFVWAGMDYMGEAAVGSWEYEDYAPKHGSQAGWLSAGSGRIDLTGKPLGEAAYTKVALEQAAGPVIAVRPVYQTGKHSPSAWKMTDAMESWSYRGCEGFPAVVEVYVRAAAVELFINNKAVGKKRLKNSCRAVFKTRYESGTITAAAYDETGREIARSSLITAGEETILSMIPETSQVKPGGLAYVRLKYTDANGITKPMERHRIRLKAEHGVLAGVGSACPYYQLSYQGDTTDTYYGEALAVVRAVGSRPIVLTAGDGVHHSTVTIAVETESAKER